MKTLCTNHACEECRAERENRRQRIFFLFATLPTCLFVLWLAIDGAIFIFSNQ